jgi:Fur family ferric uptake transcriptional regulator
MRSCPTRPKRRTAIGDLNVEDKSLRSAGLKITVPRLKILEILERNSMRHLSAEDIYRILLESNEDIGLATIYRVLTQFEAAGLVARHHFEGGTAVFELKPDEHHDHIVCLGCGRIEEFADSIIEERQQTVAKSLGFVLRDHSLILYGDCAQCVSRKQSRKA